MNLTWSDIKASILRKAGVTTESALNYEERETLRRYRELYTQPDVTIDDLKRLLPAEAERARTELTEYANDPNKDLFYKAYLRLLNTLTAIITAPEREREQLRAELKRKFNLE